MKPTPEKCPPHRFRSLGVLDALREFHLPPVPYLQIVMARAVLGVDFAFPKKTTITIDGLEHLEGDEPLMVAMNHTDRFNYMPFMHEIDQRGFSPLAPWVKGKYYRNSWLARWLCWCACVPVPSRGFLLTLDWYARMDRGPAEDEYRQLRRLGDGEAGDLTLTDEVSRYLECAPGNGPEGFFREFQRHFEGLSGEVVRINEEAMELGYRPLVFPQGTRSKTLTRGFSGIVQMALHTGAKILPVGVSGSEKLYPGDIPFSKGGTVHYSIGEPFDPSAQGDSPGDFVPLTIQASRRYGPLFDKLTARLMQRIHDLLPPGYGFPDR